MSEPTIRKAVSKRGTRMDAPLKLATSDGERWAYVADKLLETAAQNRETAVILARVTEQLDDHERQLRELKAAREKDVDRALDSAAQQQDADGALASGSGFTMSALLNRVYSDVRVALFVGTVAGGALVAAFSHIGISFH